MLTKFDRKYVCWTHNHKDGACFDTQPEQEEHLNALMQEQVSNILMKRY